MPELSRFYNIIIKMQYLDVKQHHKPHIHAFSGQYSASIGLDGELLAGALPVKELRMVQAWIAIHETELYIAWGKAVKGERIERIDPLR